MTMRLAAILALLVLWPAAAIADPDLAVGQVWSIRAATPSPARLIIGRIEPVAGGRTAVSVSMVDVPTAHGLISIADLPFERAALIASLGQLVASGQPVPPGFAAGYQEWRAGGHGGVFAQPVAEVLAAIVSHLPPPGQPATPPGGGREQTTAAADRPTISSPERARGTA